MLVNEQCSVTVTATKTFRMYCIDLMLKIVQVETEIEKVSFYVTTEKVWRDGTSLLVFFLTHDHFTYVTISHILITHLCDTLM